jgi:hypothetical protein
MKYEKTPIKQNKNLGREVAIKSLEQLSTSVILWQLVKRHRVGLLAAWAITMTILYLVPFAPDLVTSIAR